MLADRDEVIRRHLSAILSDYEIVLPKGISLSDLLHDLTQTASWAFDEWVNLKTCEEQTELADLEIL